MRNQRRNLEQLSRHHKGGGGGGDIPPAVAPPPPIQTKAVDIQQASKDIKVQQKRRRGIASTTQAGETGAGQSTIMQRLGG